MWTLLTHHPFERDIANALSDEFVVMVRELETPNAGEMPEARVIVEQLASIPGCPCSSKYDAQRCIRHRIGFDVGRWPGSPFATNLTAPSRVQRFSRKSLKPAS